MLGIFRLQKRQYMLLLEPNTAEYHPNEFKAVIERKR